MEASPNYRSSNRTGGSYRSGRYPRENYRQGRNGYVYGNLAHQLEEVPERRTQPVRRRKAKVYPQQKPVALPASMELSSFLFLAAAAIVVVVAAFIYLQVQSGITQMKNDVIALQSEIAETKQENEDTYQKMRKIPRKTEQEVTILPIRMTQTIRITQMTRIIVTIPQTMEIMATVW